MCAWGDRRRARGWDGEGMGVGWERGEKGEKIR